MKRQEIVSEIGSALKGITVDTGYSMDLRHVYDWLTTPLSEGDVPAAIVRDTSDTIGQNEGYGSSKHTLTVEIEVYLVGGDGLEAAARMAADDVLRAVGSIRDSELFDGIAAKSAEIAVEQSDKKIAAAKIEIEVSYWTENWTL